MSCSLICCSLDFGRVETAETPAAFSLTLKFSSVKLNLVDSLIISGFEVVQGRLELLLAETVCQLNKYAGESTLQQRILFGVRSMHSRYCIRSATGVAVAPEWEDCMISPHLGTAVAAVRLVCDGVLPSPGKGKRRQCLQLCRYQALSICNTCRCRHRMAHAPESCPSHDSC